MSGSGPVLLVLGACLLAIALFTLLHRRDAFGAILALVLAFDACAAACLGFATGRATSVEAAQLEAFALVAEVIGAAAVAAGASLATVLRRRVGPELLLEAPGRGAAPAVEAVGESREEAEEPDLGGTADEPAPLEGGAENAQDGDASEPAPAAPAAEG